MKSFEDHCISLMQYDQFINYSITERDGRRIKLPINQNGHMMNAHTSGNWLSYQQAKSFSANIGFVLTENDPFLFIDLDHVLKDEKLCDWAEELLTELPTTYTEISPSGDGLHLYYMMDDTPDIPRHKQSYPDSAAIEVYFQKRYFTITGCIYIDSPVSNINSDDLKVLAKYMDWKNKSVTSDDIFSSTGGCMTDDEVLQKLFSAINGLDSLKLFNGDTSLHHGDHSSADLSLVSRMAFFTQDPAQIDRLFRQSKLMRTKWNEIHSSTDDTYGEMTINEALSNLNDTYVGQSEKKTKPKMFEFIDGEQLLKRPMQTDWLIENYIPTDATVMLFGSPASGKSLIALEMASCIVSGENWHDLPVKQGKVAYIAGEGFNGISKRFKALVKDKDMPVEKFHCSKIAMDLFDEKSSLSVLSAVQSMNDLRLIIVDTLHRNFSGDENQSSNFATALKHCDLLRNATGATVMLVHHSGHKSSDRGRGSSSMTGAMDAEFKVRKTKKDEVLIECTKMKDDELSKSMAFNIEPIVIGTENGKPVTAPRLKKAPFFKSSKDLTLNPTEQIVFDGISKLSSESKTPIRRSEWKASVIDQIQIKEGSKDPQGAKSKQFNRCVHKLLMMELIEEADDHFTLSDPAE